MKRSVLIIAEAGVNHNGDFSIAKKLIQAAADAGADYVKFQTFHAESIVVEGAEKAQYQKANADREESQSEMLKRLELTETELRNLASYAQGCGIGFLSSPFDVESVDMLHGIGMQIFKIPSGEITNVPYLRRIGDLQKTVILSTGMATIAEIETAIGILRSRGTNEITLLHCNTEYPTPMEDVNLTAMTTLASAFHVPVGYSDHTLGIEVPVAAVALGATVIEKHFTIDRSLPGPDHQASLEPFELTNMIRSIRNIESALGDGVKRPSQSELKNINTVRKSIVAKEFIKKGEVLTEKNLTTKRPGHGISASLWDFVIGTRAIHDFQKDEMVVL